MKTSAPVFLPFLALVVIVGAAQLSAPRIADAIAPGEVSPVVSVSPFEYFPAQFVMDAAESGEHIPSF